MRYLIEKDIKLIINFRKIILSILVCLLIFLTFTTMFKDFMEEKRVIDQVRVGIVDEEQSFLTGMLIDNFKQNESFSGLFEIQVASEEELMVMYNQNELSAIVYLPKDFTDSLYSFENVPLEMTLNPNFPLKNTVLENIMGSYATFIKSVDVGIYSLYNALKDEGMARDELREINERFSLNMVMTALNRNTIFDLKPITTYPSATSMTYFAYAIMILVIIFTATSASNAYNDEIADGSLKRFIALGGSVTQFGLSKVLVVSMNILMLLVPIILIILFYIGEISFVMSLGLLVMMILATIFFSSLALLFGVLFHQYKINALFTSLMTLILGLIGGQFIPIQIMPTFIQELSSFTPNYWLLKVALELNHNLITNAYMILCASLAIGILIINIMQGYVIKRSRLWEK